MGSRMDKYYKDEKQEKTSRTTKNKNIYTEIDDDDYENLNLTSNISIIGSDADNLDIDDIKKLLDQKYRRPTREVDIEDFESDYDIDSEDTKEYDLKKIIEDAHRNKTPDYDRERFKKLRETQFEILNSLNVDKSDEPEIEATLTTDEATLMNLIKTVNENALKSKTTKLEMDDLLEDLKGGEKTEVLEPIDLDDEEPDKKPSLVEELEKTKQLSRQELDDEITRFTTKLDDVISSLKEISEEQEKYEEEYDDDDDATEENILSKTEELANSFYTGKYHIDAKDMDDGFDDLESELNGGSIAIKILILLLVIIVLAVIVYLLNKYLNLGLF